MATKSGHGNIAVIKEKLQNDVNSIIDVFLTHIERSEIVNDERFIGERIEVFDVDYVLKSQIPFEYPVRTIADEITVMEVEEIQDEIKTPVYGLEARINEAAQYKDSSLKKFGHTIQNIFRLA